MASKNQNVQIAAQLLSIDGTFYLGHPTIPDGEPFTAIKGYQVVPALIDPTLPEATEFVRVARERAHNSYGTIFLVSWKDPETGRIYLSASTT